MPPLLKVFDFGNEAGEDAGIDELEQVYVEQPILGQFLSPTSRLKIVRAKKGVGKSALLSWATRQLQLDPTRPLVIRLNGSDLVRGAFGLTGSLSSAHDRVHDWQTRLCMAVNRELAKTISLAIDDNRISIIEYSELAGFKQRNLVRALADRFSNLLNRYHPSTKEPGNHIEALKRLTDLNVWILIDDLDATFQKQPSEIDELTTFFSACRYLTNEVAGVNVRVTLRTDVWPLIRKADEALSKVEQYIVDLEWSPPNFRTFLAKRVKWQADVHHFHISTDYSPALKEEHLIAQIFDKNLDWADSVRPPHAVLYTLAYRRPRWAIQLSKAAQAAAIREGADKIQIKHIQGVLESYGLQRIADLVTEHRHQCAKVDTLLQSFRTAPKRMARNELEDWIRRRITNLFGPQIDGVVTREPFRVAHFLYRIGFIIARRDHDDGSYEHIFFEDRPDLLESANIPEPNIVWEIHPCYREALDVSRARDQIEKHPRQRQEKK